MNRFGIFCLDASSLAIVLFILSICYHQSFIYSFCCGAFLFLLCWSMVKLALYETEADSVSFETVEEEDNKVYWIFGSLIIPAIQGNFHLPFYQYAIIGFVFLIVYWKSISFVYNPLLLLMGYHYYHVTVSGKSFSLISKQKIINPHNSIDVGKLSNNLIISKKGG